MSYDGLAPHYGFLERLVFGSGMQTCRTALLEHAPRRGTALLLGEGRGAFLAEAAARRPETRFVVVERSARMRAAADARLRRDDLARADRVQWVAGDVREVALPPAEYAWIAACFFLDSFEGEELRAVVRRVSRVAPPGTPWLVCDFDVPDRGLRRLRARLWTGLLYRCFRAVTDIPARRLEDPAHALGEIGLVPCEDRSLRGGLLRARWFRPPRDSLDGRRALGRGSSAHA